MESELKTAASSSTLSEAAPSKDGDLAVTEVGSVGVATPKLYHQDQPDLEDSVHLPDQADSKVGASAVALLARVGASEAVSEVTEEDSAATEEASVDEEASATKVVEALEDDPMASVVALRHLPMLHLAQAVVVVAGLDLVGMVEVRTVAHP